MRLSTTPEISTLIATGSPVAIGVSCGKDRQASALAVCEHLDRFGHRPRPGVAKLRHFETGMRKTKTLATTPGRLMWVAGHKLCRKLRFLHRSRRCAWLSWWLLCLTTMSTTTRDCDIVCAMRHGDSRPRDPGADIENGVVISKRDR